MFLIRLNESARVLLEAQYPNYQKILADPSDKSLYPTEESHPPARVFWALMMLAHPNLCQRNGVRITKKEIVKAIDYMSYHENILREKMILLHWNHGFNGEEDSDEESTPSEGSGGE